MGMIASTGADYLNNQSVYGNVTSRNQRSYYAATPTPNCALTEIFDKLNHRSGQPNGWKVRQINDSAKLYNVPFGKEDIAATQSNNINQRSTTSKHLNSLKQVFSLSDEDLAASLGSSRKTVHNWQKNNTKPNKIKLEKLLLQSAIAAEWIANGYPSTLSMDPSDKKALVDLLTADETNKDKILFFGSGLMLSSNLQDIEDPFS